MSGAGVGWTEVQSPLHSRISFLGSLYHPEALVPSVGHLLASRTMDTKKGTLPCYLHWLPRRDVRPVVLGWALQVGGQVPHFTRKEERCRHLPTPPPGPQLVDDSWGVNPRTPASRPSTVHSLLLCCPHRTRLAPQAFSGGCGHCMRVDSFLSCLTLGHPMGCSLPGSSIHRILQTRMLDWIVMASSRGSSQTRDQLISCNPCTAEWFFTTEPPGKPAWSCIK